MEVEGYGANLLCLVNVELEAGGRWLHYQTAAIQNDAARLVGAQPEIALPPLARAFGMRFPGRYGQLIGPSI
jgi:hypothetical protein